MERAPCDGSVTVQGCTLQMLSQGREQAPVLLYLHAGDGLDRSRALIGRLAQDFRVVAPSPPGFDASGPVGEFRTVDDLSYLYLGVMDTLDLRDVILAGVSFGAWLAAEIAVKTQQRIAGLALINPLGIKIGAPDETDITDIFYHTHRDVRTLLYADGKADDTDYAQVDAAVVMRSVRNREALTWFGWSPLLHNPRLLSRLHRIRVPTLLLRAEHDRVVSERYTRAFADAIAGARLEQIAGAGHYVHDERPDELAARIATFAATATPAGSAAASRVAETLP